MLPRAKNKAACKQTVANWMIEQPYTESLFIARAISTFSDTMEKHHLVEDTWTRPVRDGAKKDEIKAKKICNHIMALLVCCKKSGYFAVAGVCKVKKC